MSIASERTAGGTIGLRRLFTSPGVHPFDEIVWERRDARIAHWQTGAVAFEQLGVEFPAAWSQNATNIVAQKYFRGTLGTAERESSLRQVVDRIVDTITQWGVEGDYFADQAEADAFSAELKYILVTQRAAFNSPVWFNIGVAGVPAQASACFILSVDDEMTSILNWYREEGIIFKGGSGTGVNLSDIRSSKEPMTGGGTASGPVSFMRGADASAGTIKSGGKTRRAAKMVILDADHPDIEEFIWCKAIEERKARALRDAGFDMDLDGADSFSVQYQNANNSVRVTDEFMQAVVDDADWDLVAVTTGEVLETVRARDLWRQIAEAAWECADPGLQFDTTINRWHTAPNTGRITASNPCFTGDSLVHTDKGLIRFDELVAKANIGEEFQVWTHDITNVDAPSEEMHLTTPEAYMITGRNPIQRLRFSNGSELRCTPGHAIFTANRGWVAANELTDDDDVRTVDTTIRLVDRIDEGVELTYNLSEPRNHSYVVNGVVVRNCSEYFHLDNSACNLASINLLKYLGDDGAFDVGAFTHTVDVVFTAQEILVGRADYPTEQIAETTRAFRQLGLGFANVGALLMALGLPYDSDEGRAWAAEITSLMTGTAYGASARIASRVGPFEGYADNEEPMLRVLEMHRDANRVIAAAEGVPADLVAASRQAWDNTIEAAHRYGVRNSQAVVIAPTGTIALAMDCDTTGIEPDLSLVKTKKLVGGGTMSIVNQTIPRALRRLGYSPDEVDDIVTYVDEHLSIVGAPHLKPEHLPVFACSMGDNTIHHTGHVRMMAAVQPAVSGGISKTINVPEQVTVDEIADLHRLSWELGLKSVAIYRDNSKVGQPLSTSKPTVADVTEAVEVGPDGIVERIIERVVHQPVRQKLPRTRRGKTFEFRVADCKGFATIGEYDNGQPGEIFLTVSKQGSTMAGVMDAFAKSVSYGLQYGVPLRAFVEAFTNMRFEPAGMTDDPDLRFASSIMDYLFRRLALEYMTYDERAELGIFSVNERLQPTLPGVEEAITETSQGSELPPDPKSVPSAAELSTQMELGLSVPTPEDNTAARGIVRPNDAPMCMQCGVVMMRAGSCFACPSCGNTSGCS